MDTAKGISGLVLLPAKDFEWELKGRYTIEVPLRGKIKDLESLQSTAPASSVAGEDEFDIFADDVFLLWELTRVLFASSKYPSLKDDECFNVVALETYTDEGVDMIRVHGETIKSIGV